MADSMNISDGRCWMRLGFVATIAAWCIVASSPAQADDPPCDIQLDATILPPEDPEDGGGFYSLDVSGTTLIAGYLDVFLEHGVAHIFTRAFEEWVQGPVLLGNDVGSSDRFGYSVAISGDTAIVGAPGKYVPPHQDGGAAYIFTRSGGAWIQVAKLIASDPSYQAEFGYRVAIDGDTAFVTSRYDDESAEDAGAVYVFQRAGSDWIQTQKLLPTSGDGDRGFGLGIAISGDDAIVGAEFSSAGALGKGAGYIYARTDGIWTEVAKIAPEDEGWNFGASVSISGDTAIIGRHLDDDNGLFSGSAYFVTRTGGLWNHVDKVTPPDPSPFQVFGESVSVNGNKAAISAAGDDGGNGAMYFYYWSDGAWSLSEKLVNGNTSNDVFGARARVDGNLLIASSHPVVDGTRQVVAHVYTVMCGMPGDFDGNSVVDEQDRAILCGALGSMLGDPSFVAEADFNFDDVVNHIDQAQFNILLPPCAGDIVASDTLLPPADGLTDGADLAYLLSSWGAQPSCADFVSSATFQPPPDGKVDAADLAYLLGNWGPCP